MSFESGDDDPSAFGGQTTAARVGTPSPENRTNLAFDAPGVDTPSGRLSLSVALPASDARGAGPGLVLGYSSGNGNSLFGYGWAVPVSYIGAHTREGLPRYDGTDAYCLDGGDAFVATPQGPQPNAADWREVSTIAGVSYEITRFQPMINLNLSRVERLQNQSDGSIHWRVYEGDGTVRVYGQSGAARLADPQDATRVYRWLLERSYDVTGNCTQFSFVSEDARNVVGSAAQADRASGRSPFANLLLKRVSYGPLAPYDPTTETLPDFGFHTVFDYGDHDDAFPTLEPTVGLVWPARADAFSDRRGGFDVRTNRLCQRVLHFHDLPELGATPTYIRGLRLSHTTIEGRSCLTSITQESAQRSGGGYVVEALPPQTFAYSEFQGAADFLPLFNPDDERQALGDATVPPGPGNPQGTSRIWADISGNGLPGLLSDDGGQLAFASNLGDGRFGPAQPLALSPVHGRLGTAAITLETVDRNGRTALVFRSPHIQGYFPLNDDGSAEPFRAFESVVGMETGRGHVHIFDADGDGYADVLRFSEGGTFLARGRGAAGPKPYEQVSDGIPPMLHTQGMTHAVRLADMTGDGLQDIVEIGADTVRYWPALGHGKFGHAMAMQNAPKFAETTAFDPNRVQLASLTGAGAADIIYAGGGQIGYALNVNGNGFGAVRQIAAQGVDDPLHSISVLDLLGKGTPAIVVSAGTGDPQGTVQYVTPAGPVRPFLMIAAANGMGSQAQITYSTSTVLAQQALNAGHPWRSNVPYPIACVTEIRHTDLLRDQTTTGRFSYAHAFLDPRTRELVGFARVDMWDTSKSDEAAKIADPDNALLQPTLHVRTWLDTGLPPDHPLSPKALASEWWDADGVDAPYRPTQPAIPKGLDPTEAARARRGGTLRVERYALDGSAQAGVPLDVKTGTQTVVAVQPATATRAAVLRAHAAEEIKVTYDRATDDPAVEHTIALENDALGMAILAASIAYARRGTDPSLPASTRAAQARTLISISEREFTGDADAPAPLRRFLRRRPWRRLSWGLEGQVAPSGAVFQANDVLQAFHAAPVVGYEAPTGTVVAKRLLSEVRDAYLDDDLVTERGFGDLGTLPISARRYALALTPSLRAAAWPTGFVTDADLAASGYLDLDGDGRHWMPSGAEIRGPASRDRFLLPDAFVDATGVRVNIFYDTHALFPVRETDVLGNVEKSEIDYRVMQPFRTTDKNGLVSEVAFDVQGRVTARAISGPNGEGDTIADPTTTLSYDMTAFATTGQPNWQRLRARETHGDPTTRWFETVNYFDGEGGTLQSRSMAEPGMADRVVAGAVSQVDTGVALRWLVSPAPLLTNKATAVGTFDPFYSDTDAFQNDPVLINRGGKTVSTLDGDGETIRTDFPDGSFEYSTQTQWASHGFDRNDCILDSDLYGAAGAPDPAQPAPGSDDGHAIWGAARHSGTASINHRDPTGAVVLGLETLSAGQSRITRMERTPGGHQVQSFDSADRLSLSERFDMLGRVLQHETLEGGRTHVMYDVAGRRSRIRKPDGTVFDILRDVVQRPLGARVSPADGSAPIVPSLTIYGETHSQVATRFLRGKAFAVLDGSGLTLFDSFTFKGDAASASKRFLVDPLVSRDWAGLIGLSVDAALQAAEPFLSPEVFSNTTTYDAFGRAVQSVTPDGSVLDSTFDAGGNRVTVALTPPGAGAPTQILSGQEFDAFGTVDQFDLGDGTVTQFDRHPDTRRLLRQTTTRLSDGRALLDAGYVYDPVGNITTLNDLSADTVYFDNAVTSGKQRFEYDALYQLTRATGRELASLANSAWDNVTGVALPHSNNTAAVRPYVRAFSYDVHGNMTDIQHQAGSTAWHRRMRYGPTSNRLEAVSAPGDAEGVFSLPLTYDGFGRMTSGAGLGPMVWSGTGALEEVDLGGGGAARYISGAGGVRVRKIITRANGFTEEWIYLGNLDIHRRRDAGGTLIEERQTLKIMQGSNLLARIETKTVDTANAIGLNQPLFRFRHTDLTGAISVETTEIGAVIHYETFHPFGTTAYRSSSNAAEVALSRYRYAGRETDVESGLIAMGHRYYARWIGRFISPDLAGPVEGANLYVYAANNPVMRADPSGMQSAPETEDIPNTGADATFADLQAAARLMGREIGPSINESNYQDTYIDGVWRILVELSPDAEVAEPGEPTGAGDGSEDAGSDTPAEEPAETETGGEGEGADERESAESTGPEEGESEEGVQLGGAALVSTYNSIRRSLYATKNIERAVAAIKVVEEAISNGDEVAAWAAARTASEGRDIARRATQNSMRYSGGRQLSALLDRNRSFPATQSYYEGKVQKPLTRWGRTLWRAFTPGLPPHHPTPATGGGNWQQASRNVAIGAGKTNRAVSAFSKFGKVAGPIGIVVGLGSGAVAVYTAAPEDRTRVAAGEVAAFAAGAIGFAVGSAATAAAIGFFISNPVGWVAGVIVIATLIGGGLTAYGASEGARAGTNWLFGD